MEVASDYVRMPVVYIPVVTVRQKLHFASVGFTVSLSIYIPA
jgi:hypothetical protein